MPAWKQPPRAKLYEALSAVGDGRVRVAADGRAEVVSSARDKTYDVEWSEGPGEALSITSNDNASYWQGYLGYPIIATLLVTGRLPCDAAVAAALAGVDWHELNRRHRRDYDAAVAEVLAALPAGGPGREAVDREVDRLAAALAALDLARPPRRRRPPR